MSVLEEHVAALVIDAVKRKPNNYSAFAEDIPDLMRSQFGFDIDESVLRNALTYLAQFGAVETLKSELAGDLLKFHLEDAFYYFTSEATVPSAGTSAAYDRQYEFAHSQAALKAYYFGGDAWIGKVLAKLRSGEFAEVMPISEVALEVAVPASDRIVELNHNQVSEIDSVVEQVETLVTHENSIAGNERLRSRYIGQLRALRELVRAESVRAYLLYETAVRMLGTLIEKYKGQAIGETAKQLLHLLIEHVFKS